MVAAAVGIACPALAHSNDQAFVLLLPTGVYSTAGVAVVVLTMLILAALPRLTAERPVEPAPKREPQVGVSSILSFLLLCLLIAIGLVGPPGPLENVLPLSIWLGVWMCLPVVQPFFDVWKWIDPWSGPLHLTRAKGWIVLPAVVGRWPAVVLFVGFALFQLADIAPEDPARLAIVVGLYWLLTALGCLVFGPQSWLSRGEMFSVFFTALAGLLRRRDLADYPLSTGVFYLTILAVGSFDGFNETFVWLAWIGINPLEYPGRSALVLTTSAGLVASVVLLWVVFAVCIMAGRWLSGVSGTTPGLIGQMAKSILPIALGYHIAHFLTAFLVQGQYFLVALSDPLGTGADWLKLGPHFVTTGFFFVEDTVRLIWLGQAAAVVVAHVWAVILAHRIALGVAADERAAVRLQIPLSAFMVVYTIFGLWLLAAPRGA